MSMHSVKSPSKSLEKPSPTRSSERTNSSKQIEKVDKAISKSKDKAKSEDHSEVKNDTENTNRDVTLSQQHSPPKFKTFDSRENFLTLSYLMWENTSNICWLDASMSLLVHNRSLQRLLKDSKPSQVGNIIEKYNKAILLLNDFPNSSNIDVRMQEAKAMLKEIQESSLKYLQPRLKYKDGEPDSAFCSLYNLISESKVVRSFFEVSFSSTMECQKCSNHRISKHSKPIITLSKVKSFEPTAPVSVCQCPVCKKPEQNLVMSYKTLPQCLVFHFESGAGKGELQTLDFTLNERRYRLTGVMVLEKNQESDLNHFLTWIRDPDTDSWLECNDLNSDILSFSVVPPFIDLEEVYIVMYEASDLKGSTFTQPLTISAQEKEDFKEGVAKSNAAIPLIDISDDEAGSTARSASKSGCRVQKCELGEACEDPEHVDSKAPLTKDSEADETKEHAISVNAEESQSSTEIETPLQIGNGIEIPKEPTLTLPSVTEPSALTLPSASVVDDGSAELQENSFTETSTLLENQVEKEEFALKSSEETAAVQSQHEWSLNISSDSNGKESGEELDETAASELSDEDTALEKESSPFLKKNITFGAFDITVTNVTEKAKGLASQNLNNKFMKVSNINNISSICSQISSQESVTVEYPDVTITRLTDEFKKRKQMSDEDQYYAKISPNQNKNSGSNVTCVLKSKFDFHKRKTQKVKKEKKKPNCRTNLLNNSKRKLTNKPLTVPRSHNGSENEGIRRSLRKRKCTQKLLDNLQSDTSDISNSTFPEALENMESNESEMKPASNQQIETCIKKSEKEDYMDMPLSHWRQKLQSLGCQPKIFAKEHIDETELAEKCVVKDVRVEIKKLDEGTLMAELSGPAKKKQNFRTLSEMKQRTLKPEEIEIHYYEVNDTGEKVPGNESKELQNNSRNRRRPVDSKILSSQVASSKDVSDQFTSVHKSPVRKKKMLSTVSSPDVKIKNISDLVIDQEGSTESKQFTKVTDQTNDTQSPKNSLKGSDILSPNLDENPIPGYSQDVNRRKVGRRKQSAIAALTSSAAKKIKAPESNPNLRSSNRKYTRTRSISTVEESSLDQQKNQFAQDVFNEEKCVSQASNQYEISSDVNCLTSLENITGSKQSVLENVSVQKVHPNLGHLIQTNASRFFSKSLDLKQKSDSSLINSASKKKVLLTSIASNSYSFASSDGSCSESDSDTSSNVKTDILKENSQNCKPNCDCHSLNRVEIVQGVSELFYKELLSFFRLDGK